MVDPMDAERQLDLVNQKADLLAQAGRKLELATTIDNPVERATLELDAEKLLRNTGGIQIMTNEITKATGQEMQLPDTDHLATDATSTNDTDLMDPFADATAPDAGGLSSAGAPDDANDVAVAAAPDDAVTPAAATASTDDPLGASPGDATAATATTTLEPAATDTSGSADPSDVALGDPGGADVAAAAPAFDAPTVADAGASDFAADPAADAGNDLGDSSGDDAGF